MRRGSRGRRETYTPSADSIAEIGAGDGNVNTDVLDNYGEGLMFAANWSVTGNQELDATIDYDVTVLNNNKLTVETILINGAMISCTCASPPGDGARFTRRRTGKTSISKSI
jgi:hypothetical protein